MFFIAQFLSDEYQNTQFYYSFMDFVQYIKKNYHDGFILVWMIISILRNPAMVTNIYAYTRHNKQNHNKPR